VYRQLSLVVREYVLWPESVEHMVKGRIVEHLDADPAQRYGWDVSHHYKPSEGAGVYYPSSQSGKSIEEVELLMLAYLKSFSGLGVISNGRY
jgi:hypothetical protein